MHLERPGLPLRPAAAAALSGVAATAVALGAAELFAGFLPGIPSLVASVGQWIVDNQPPGAKDIAVSLFGTNDKAALELIITGASLAIGAGLGLLAVRAHRAATWALAGFGAAGFLAALGDPLVVPTYVAVSTATAVALGIGVLTWLGGQGAGRTADGVDPAPDEGNPAVLAGTRRAAVAPWSRRGFLLRAGSLTAAAVAAGFVGRRSIAAREAVPANNPAIPQPGKVATLPAGADLAADLGVKDVTPIVVPTGDFYRIDTALVPPTVDVGGWTLRVTGMVDRPVTLTYQQLVALPLVEQYVTIACVSNEVGGDLVGNAKWTGVRLREVLAMAGVQPAASQLMGVSVDGFTAGMPMAWVMDPAREPMIAVKMNDEVLPRLHGYPARLIIPGLYGYVSATKWLSELRVTTMEAEDGYWIPLGWAKEAPILTQSRIDIPTRGTNPRGKQHIAGVAWAPDRGISRVEVQVDGGNWVPARLSAPISDATWVQWILDWDPAPGEHTIVCRATDGKGVTQTVDRTRPDPDGARGWHIRVTTIA